MPRARNTAVTICSFLCVTSRTLGNIISSTVLVGLQDSSLLQPNGGVFTVPVAGSYLVTATGIVDFGWRGGNPRNAKLRCCIVVLLVTYILFSGLCWGKDPMAMITGMILATLPMSGQKGQELCHNNIADK